MVIKMETSTMIALGALLISLIGLILNSRKDTRTDGDERSHADEAG